MSKPMTLSEKICTALAGACLTIAILTILTWPTNASAQTTPQNTPDVCAAGTMNFLQAIQQDFNGPPTEDVTFQANYGHRLNPTSNVNSVDGSLFDPNAMMDERSAQYIGRMWPDPVSGVIKYETVSCQVAADFCDYGDAALNYDEIARKAPWAVAHCGYLPPASSGP